MTAQFLNNELTNLVQEAKRKNSELRQAAEKSLQDLKSIPATADVSVELSSKAGFVTPFLIACGTRNTKFSTIGIVCLQRLITSKALAKSRLKEILEAFREAANLGVDIQLKILQALPPLLQNYAGDLQGPLLGEALLICAILQGSKMGVVNNTAAATLSQIVISIFDKVTVEDEKALEVPTIGEAPSGDGTIPVRPAALDAYGVFYDLCLLTEGQKPMILRFENLPQPFGLELIESVLTNHPNIFLSHPEQAYILRTRVAPLVMRALSERLNFPSTVRITRVLYILLRRHLSILSSECEVSLSLLTHILEPDASQPWKRALCMEVFRGICAEPALVRKIFSEYDAKENRKPVIKELMGAMTRLATEKPGIIGLGAQSSTPLNQQLVKDSSSEAAALEAGGVAGIITGAVGLEANVTGLGAWSIIRVPCIDQLDKIEPPSIPDSYIYYLTLVCLNSFSEGLAKFVLPLASSSDTLKRRSRMMAPGSGPTGSDSDSTARPATPDRGSTSSPKKHQLQLKRKPTIRLSRVPVNPLSLESHPLYAEIVTASGLVDTCWPAVLAACSAFLCATLDNELYHGLVRAFQKFTQVAGVFRLNTPRDAFLTTFGKAAVPSNVFSANIHSSSTANSAPNESMFSSAKGLLGVESSNIGTGGTNNNTTEAPSLNVRNLLCLRALLNLGVGLGPTLEASWTIVLETLQQADYVIFTSIRRGGRTLNPSSRTESQKVNDSASLMSNIMNELQAVEVAAGKMFEGTRDFPDEAFVAILSACCRLLTPDDERPRGSLDNPRSPRSGAPGHKRLPSMSGVSMASQVIGDHAFALAKLNELAQLNIDRLVGPNPEASGWNNLTNYLVSLTGTRGMGSNIRLKAIHVLNEVIVAAAKAVPTEGADNLAEAQRRILVALKAGVDYGHQSGDSDAMTKQTELEIHRAGLEALNAILEHQGQSLIAGWDIAFDIITSVFDSTMVWRRDSIVPVSPETTAVDPNIRSSKSGTLIRSSFSSLELICSDFLASIPTSCILVLIDALFAFCSQKDDLNISLTTITFFWNASDFLQSKGDSEQLTKGDALTSQAENERDLLDIVETSNVDSRSSLWMLLLLRLASVSKDARAEVRNGSIQTLFRIFDTYGHQLGPQGWNSCLKIVVFRMMNIDPKDLALYSSSGNMERRQWDDTIKLVLGGIGTLYSNYFDIFTQQANFRNTWSVFIKYLETLLGWKSFEVSTTVFNVLSRVLDQVKQPQHLASESRDEVWTLWSSQGVKFIEGSVSSSASGSGTGVQEALTAYVDVFKPLYRLLEPSLSTDLVQKSLDVLKECVLYPDAPSYFQDIEIVTPLQASILDCVKIIRTDIPEVPALLLNMISQFVVVAYNARSLNVESDSGKKRLPTCIALSTQSMDLLEKIAVKHIEDAEIYTSSTMAMTFKSLEVPIGLKYNFIPANVSPAVKRPNQWVFATQAVLKIVRSALPAMAKLDLPDEVRRDIWTKIVKIAGSIVCASNTKSIDDSVLWKDEAFDIDAFRQLRELIIIGLGQWVVPDEILLQYVEAVFWSSMLYDISDSASPEEWLSQKIHGSTEELILERRHKMSYVCIDELFSLVSVSDDGDGDEALKRVTTIAAPWLVRRVAMVLRSYISDQPLRGRMPQPVRQREEMMYVLREIIKLDSGLETIDIDSPYIPPSSKRLLFPLFPLFTKCIAVAQGDHELLTLISKALGEIGGALGVC